MFEEQPELHFLYAQIAAYNPDRTREEMLAIIRAAGARTAEDAASLEVPVLFIAGEEDIVVPPRVLELAMRHFRDARMEIVPRAGHSVYFERADEFNAIVERFLIG
jgi:pimeloyl-ACP methyl ester carboxylesterase